MTKAMRLLENLVVFGLTIHAAFTVFDNLPDAGRPLAYRIRAFGPLPQWRFFAPNPGIENFHLYFRIRDPHGWHEWNDIPLKNRLAWSSWLWNPNGRAPKVLFDATQQLMVTKSSGATYEWILQSEPYELLKHIVSDFARRTPDADLYQFMILSSLPETGDDGLKPLLVSEELPINPVPAAS